jgi:gliding motility-associated-like protein
VSVFLRSFQGTLFLLLAVACWGHGVVQAQTAPSSSIWTVNKGDTISVKAGTILSIVGSFWNKPRGAVYNRDTIYVTDTLRNTGGNELFRQQLAGTVVLRGGEQVMTGTDPISFHTLRLRGLGAKRQDQDERVTDTLDLGDRMLDTRTHTMFVSAYDTGAIRRRSGFVRSDTGGWLRREMSMTTFYHFPVGDSFPVLRYRPISVRVISLFAVIHTFRVRMSNYDPNQEGLDRSRHDTSICAINPLYFHRIDQPYLNSQADIRVFFDPNDPARDRIAHWEAPIPLHWQNKGGTQLNGTTLNALEIINHVGFDSLNDGNAFALARIKPQVRFDSIPPRICRGAPPLPLMNGTPPNGYYSVNGIPQPGAFFISSQWPDGFYTITYVNPDTFGGQVFCPDSFNRQIEVYTPTPASINTLGDSTLCIGDSLQLFAIPGGQMYEWQLDGANITGLVPDSSIYVNATGLYRVIVHYNCGAVDTSSERYIEVFQRPTAAFTVVPDSNNIYVPFQFTDQSAPASNRPEDALVSWFWDFGDTLGTSNAQNPSYYYRRSGDFTVTLRVTSALGCTDTAQRRVHVSDDFTVFIPNVFTPNGDGSNDQFAVTGIGIQNLDIAIFDRWGVSMWTGRGVNAKWSGTAPNGTDASEGTYFYQLTATTYTGGRQFRRSGTVTLLR